VKRIISFLLAMVLVFTLIPQVSLQAEASSTVATGDPVIVNSGICGNNVTWTFDDQGTLTISGTGSTWTSYYDVMSWPWYTWKNQVTELVIEEGVTSISDNMFFGFANLSKVTLSVTVESIGTAAFYGCSQLTDVYYTGTETWWARIDISYANSALTDAEIHFGTETGSIASSGICGNNVTWTFDDQGTLTISGTGSTWTSYYDVMSWPWYTWKNQVTELVIEEGITSISNNMFFGFANLSKVTLSTTVESIGYAAFYGCSSLTDVYYKGTRARWQYVYVTGGNSALTNANIHFEESGAIGENLTWTFDGKGTLTISGAGPMDEVYPCPWGGLCISKVVIESGVTTISDWAFSCGDMTSVTIPDSVTTIGHEAFSYCYSLTSVSIGNGVTAIGVNAFLYCNSLTSVTIPDSVTTIRERAFDGCTSLTDVYYNGTQAQWNRITIGSSNDDLIGATIHFADSEPEVPGGSTIVNSGTCGENLTWTLDKAGTLTISGAGPMDDYVSIGPGGTTSPFSNLEGLKKVVVEYGVTSIGDWAFRHKWEYLESVELPETLISIGRYAFDSCYSLESIVIPASVTNIGDNAFSFCSQLTGILVDEDNTAFTNDSSGVLYNKDMTTLIQAPCKLSGSYTIPDGTIIIGDNAFGGCRELRNVIMPDSVTTIEFGAFDNCHGLQSVTIGTGITTISTGAFAYCSSLVDVYYAGSQNQWGQIEIGDVNECLTNATIHYLWGHSHNFTNYVSNNDATCTVDGTKTAKCDGCDETDTIADEGSKLGHSFTAYKSDSNATCTADGTETAKCDRCDVTDTQTDVDSKLGHSFTNYISNNDATCTADGTETAKCDRCDVTDTQTDVDSKLGHSFTNYISNNDATCTADGTETAKCDRCDVTDTQTDVDSKLGHSFTNYISNNDATCEADGTKTAKCDRCDVTDTVADEGSKLGHSFTNYVSNNDATCTADGTETAKCDRCDVTDTVADEGSKLGHSFTNYISNNDATCEADGTKTAKCDRCDVTDTVADEGSKLGHSFTNYVSNNDATCTADGTETAKCDRCDVTDTRTDAGSKLGHSFTNYVSDNNATYEADGTKTAKCDRCDATDTITDPGTKLPMQNGWVMENGKWYYYKNNAKQTGWVLDGKTWYYMNTSGIMQTGWIKDGGSWYYFNASGAMATGWLKSGNTWYYFNTSGAMATGWLKSGNTWYYFNTSGAMATGWLKSGNTWYYFNTSGAMATGWLKLGNTWYYFHSSGAMATGSVKIGTKTYRFNASGACLNP